MSYIRGAVTAAKKRLEFLLFGIVFVLTTLVYILVRVHALVKQISWQTSDGFLFNYIILIIITSHGFFFFLRVYRTYPTIDWQSITWPFRVLFQS